MRLRKSKIALPAAAPESSAIEIWYYITDLDISERLGRVYVVAAFKNDRDATRYWRQLVFNLSRGNAS